MISEQAILRKIEQQPKQSAGFKQLVRELGVHGSERHALDEHLRDMVRRGALVKQDGDRYALPKKVSDRNLVAGRLSMHRDGYGFVTPDSASVRERISGDIFINPQAIGNAMHGDQVLVEIAQVRSDGRAEGRIVRVAGRAHATVVGTFHYGDRYNYVTPIDEKITLDVVIPRGMELPEREVVEQAKKKERHRVLGREAKRTEIEDLENVVVDVEITDWPTPTQNPRGRVVEVLGYEDDFGVDVEIIIRKYHLPHRFPGEVLEQAQSIENIIAARELKTRRDYRSVPVVTIDGETARDFDDAVFAQRLTNGNFELQVHIADVAHYVREATPLDVEARMRGTSVYFPDRAVPMLPIELSNGICSLNPHVDRLAMSVLMKFDPTGHLTEYEILPCVIRSSERMTYTAVYAVLSGDEEARARYHSHVKQFQEMEELARILNKRREDRGSIDFDLPEPEIEFDE